MNNSNPQVDSYFTEGCGRCALVSTPQCKVHNWSQEMAHLRSLLLESGLTEELKWSMPCYTCEKSNIVMLAAFKEYCCLSFFKGALLKNEGGYLVQPTQNSQASRQLRFTNVQQIVELENVIRESIAEAIEIEKSGAQVDYKTVGEFAIPEELQRKFDNDPNLSKAFAALTPGRQKAYLLHFSAPKQAKTREARIEKYAPHIMNGKGLHD